jgi:hypothetical protein
MEWLPTSIYTSEAFPTYVILPDGLTEDLRAIRHIDRGIRRHLRWHDARGFISDDFPTRTACLASAASECEAPPQL